MAMNRASLSPVLCALLALVPPTAACGDPQGNAPPADNAEAADRKPEAADFKAECRRLEEHIFRITPAPGAERGETDPARLADLMAKVPIEDLEQCAAVDDRKVIACMQAASDVAGLRTCIPAKKS